MEPDLQNLSTDTLRRFCQHVVRFMSTIAMDPHLYFEKKLAAEFATIESSAELAHRMRQLVAWVDTTGLTNDQVRRLDEALATEDLPTFSMLREGGGVAHG